MAREPILPLHQVLNALGDKGFYAVEYTEVALASVVGTVSRFTDFDRDFRPLTRHAKLRKNELRAAMLGGLHPQPVELVRLGALHFVRDGHHRIALAREFGWASIPARVHSMCTIAYGMVCLRLAHLATKGAEREFLQRVPLPEELRAGLWLDRPQDWNRLADAAEAWGFRQQLAGRTITQREQLAEAWWTEEVEPTIREMRTKQGIRLDRCAYDIELYAAARKILSNG